MKFDYEANFRLQDCIAAMGLEEQGRVERHIAEQILVLSDEYIPFDEGGLKDSARISQTGLGTVISWNTPYARYMWNGIVYEDPQLHCAGFKTDKGWRSRNGVQKIPTDRKLTYDNGPLRGSKWVDRMMNNGGREAIEQSAREVVKR